MKKHTMVIVIVLPAILSIYGFSATTNSKQDKEQQQAQLAKSMEEGEMIYMDFCITCHRADGRGIKGVNPPLAQSDFLLNKRAASIRAVKYGQKGEVIVNGVTYNGLMAPQGLDDQEVADVMNYILNSWGNQSEKMVSIKEVAAIKETTIDEGLILKPVQ